MFEFAVDGCVLVLLGEGRTGGEPRKVEPAEMTPSSRSVFAVDFIYLEKGDFLGVLDIATVIGKGMGSEVLAMLALVSMRTIHHHQ
jgi:hypothetical protein